MSTEEKAVQLSRRYGEFGGCYVPEALWAPLQELTAVYVEALADETFLRREREWLGRRVGRPTSLAHLVALSNEVGGAQIWVKREDLCQGGSFCASSAIVQALLAERMGKEELIGETATGDFGVALGAVGAALGLKVTVLMKRDDVESEPLNAARMRELGVNLVVAEGHAPGRRQAMAQALRRFSSAPAKTFYATSSLASPAPYPQILERALSIIGRECRNQLREAGVEPEYVIAPVGSGSFAAGLFRAFVDQATAQLVGVQSGGDGQSGRGADSLVRGKPGVYLGTRSLVLQDEDGQIESTHTEAAGLAMPVAGPQHARWLQEGAVHYVTVNDAEALEARRRLTRREGIFASIESGYALAYAFQIAATLEADEHVVVGLSGSGIRDLGARLKADEEGK